MHNTKSIFLLLSLASYLTVGSFVSLAQTPDILWESYYDGALNGKDEAKYIITDTAGNIYVTGRSFESFPGGDFTTIKYSSDGTQLWADHYSNMQSGYYNYGRRLVIDSRQNVYAAGTTALHDGDLAVCKYNGNGRIWGRNYEPYFFSTYDDFGIDIDVDSAGYFYALAMVTSPDGNLFDMYLIKCDSTGNKIWDVNYTGASDADYPVDIEVTPDGNVYTLLQQFNFFGSQSRDISTFQYSTDGVQNWFSNYNGPGDGEDYPVSIELDEDENQYICGSADAGLNDDMVIMKQNIYGTRLWTYTYNGTGDGNDTAVTALKLPNGLTAATGKSKELVDGNILDAVVTMVIDSGIITWIDKYYGSDNLGASPSQMTSDAAGNLYICGLENTTEGTTDGFILKYDSDGSLLGYTSYDGGADMNDKFNSVTLDRDNNILVTGQSFTSSANADYVTVKYGNIVTRISSESPVLRDFNLEQNYPNPFNPSTIISFVIGNSSFVSLKVYDVLGNEVATLVNEYKPAGNYSLEFNAADLTSGVYFYQLRTGSPSAGSGQEFVETRKMILVK